MRSKSEIEALLDEYRQRYERAQLDRDGAIRRECQGDIGLANMRREMFHKRIQVLEWVLELEGE